MTRVELGSGRGGKDTINLYDVKECSEVCTFRRGRGRFRCIKYNGSAVIEVIGGLTKNTVDEFKLLAPCLENSNTG